MADDRRTNCVCIGPKRYPLILQRSGFHGPGTPNGRGRALDFYATLAAGPDLIRGSKYGGPAITAVIHVIHSSDCRAVMPPSKRRGRACNCGAEQLWRDLVEQAGEPYEHLPGYDTLDKQLGRKKPAREAEDLVTAAETAAREAKGLPPGPLAAGLGGEI